MRRRPISRSMQRSGHFLGQEMLSIQGHHLPDLDHAALELAQFLHQVARLLAERFTTARLALLARQEHRGCRTGDVACSRQQTHAGETQATLEAARLDSIQGIGFFPAHVRLALYHDNVTHRDYNAPAHQACD